MISTLSVVVPCHNEGAVIDRLVTQVLDVTAPLARRTELVIVDDGSSDDTYAVVARRAADDPRIVVRSFSRNFGKEAAIKAGLDASTGEAVVLMDGDLQHPPELLPEMVARYEQGADQVVARRTRTGDGRVRTALSRSYYRLVGGMMDVELEDGVGDFRLMSRAVVDAVTAMSEANRFSKGIFSWVGFDSVTIDYANVGRAAGSSRWSLPALFNYGVDGIISFNDKPLRISVWLGLGAVAVSLAYIAWLLVRFVTLGVEAPGYLTTMTAIVLLGGVQLVFLGIMGEYVGRIYYETKRRPHYIVARELNRPNS